MFSNIKESFKSFEQFVVATRDIQYLAKQWNKDRLLQVGVEVEILVDAAEFNLFAGQIVDVADIYYDEKGNPLVVTVWIEDENNAWAQQKIYAGHIRLPK